MIKKNLNLIPFLLIAVISVYSLVEFLTTNYIVTHKHYAAFILILANAFVYFFHRRLAVLLTVVILLLATMNLISFFVPIYTVSFGIGGISTPDFQWRPLLLLTFYVIVNQRFFFEWILDYQDKKNKRK